jgi:hypothetical protein
MKTPGTGVPSFFEQFEPSSRQVVISTRSPSSSFSKNALVPRNEWEQRVAG